MNMEKATLYCPRQKVFFKNLLIERYIVPAKEFMLSKTSRLEVNILGIVGEQALVLLPKKTARGEQNTALIDMNYFV
ncbi:hypothetical protein GW931_01435 [archaeon]|nr:hypothetical protein [archaeon]